MNDVARLVPTKSDAEKAEEHKAALIKAADEMIKVMDAARCDGFEFQFQITPNATGHHSFSQIALLKRF